MGVIGPLFSLRSTVPVTCKRHPSTHAAFDALPWAAGRGESSEGCWLGGCRLQVTGALVRGEQQGPDSLLPARLKQPPRSISLFSPLRVAGRVGSWRVVGPRMFACDVLAVEGCPRCL